MEKLEKEIAKYFYIKEVERDTFQSMKVWFFGGKRGIYGGQVLSQALASAMLTVDCSYEIHSMHMYFLLAGKYDTPLYFHVKRLRDGRSFASRSVLAKQDGNTIFSLTCSFQKPESRPANIQYKMPDVYPPEYKHYEIYDHKNSTIPGFEEVSTNSNLNIFDETQLLVRSATHKDSSLEKDLEAFILDRADAYKEKDDKNITNSANRNIIGPPYNLRWFRVNRDLKGCSPQLHTLFLAFISDFWSPFVITGPLLWGYNYKKNYPYMIATISHSVWFHGSVDVNKWILFEAESPALSGNRQLIKGRFYTENGNCIGSYTQENLFRVKIIENDAISSFKFNLEYPKLLNFKGNTRTDTNDEKFGNLSKL
ncbi:hypothetical protein BB559_006232 [Furculomyces boomerangus]|uniref:Acyl-CoA thioesterase II n=1 Tax=Furculomyces boomerangus TaxID=61424 RepID=A0A2T9Y407_9FUNG|nr:hypothetical protein BB559_006371 [Furculomyces boomerangus]PVU87082.1 hypothetical protein BB559_006232 [Furculomyces boomerangus]